MIRAMKATGNQNFLDYCNAAFSGEPVLFPISEKKNVVIVSEEAFLALEKAKRNAEYLEKLERADEDLKAGRVVVKSMEELEAMASE